MIRQFIPQEACIHCRGCCRFGQEDSVWLPCLLNAEIESFLKEGLPATVISAHKKIRVVSFPKEDVFICSLFNPEENRCKIYNHRPFECQLYPFLLNLKDKNIFLAVDLKCPFIKEKNNTPEFKEYAQYLTDLLKGRYYTETFKDNPQLIQTYTDALNLSQL